jgi:hypothetical protein
MHIFRIGDCVGPIASLDTVEMRKIVYLLGTVICPFSSQPVAIPTELSQLFIVILFTDKYL